MTDKFCVDCRHCVDRLSYPANHTVHKHFMGSRYMCARNPPVRGRVTGEATERFLSCTSERASNYRGCTKEGIYFEPKNPVPKNISENIIATDSPTGNCKQLINKILKLIKKEK